MCESTIYVGDLHSDVTEEFLFEKFLSIGAIKSINIFWPRSPEEGSSLQSASVEFFNRETGMCASFD